MALEFLDAFELATAAAIVARYDSGSITDIQTGRTNYCIRMSGPTQTLKKTTSASKTKIVGFAMKQTGFNVTTTFLRIMDGSTTHVYLQLDASTYTISVYRGDNTL